MPQLEYPRCTMTPTEVYTLISATYQKNPSDYLEKRTRDRRVYFEVSKSAKCTSSAMRGTWRILLIKRTNENEYIVAFRGTDSLGNWFDNIVNLARDQQLLRDYNKILSSWRNEVERDSGYISTLLGHSRGGIFVNNVVLNWKVMRIALNAAFLKAHISGIPVINLRNHRDPLSKVERSKCIEIGEGGHGVKDLKNNLLNKNWEEITGGKIIAAERENQELILSHYNTVRCIINSIERDHIKLGSYLLQSILDLWKTQTIRIPVIGDALKVFLLLYSVYSLIKAPFIYFKSKKIKKAKKSLKKTWERSYSDLNDVRDHVDLLFPSGEKCYGQPLVDDAQIMSLFNHISEGHRVNEPGHVGKMRLVLRYRDISVFLAGGKMDEGASLKKSQDYFRRFKNEVTRQRQYSIPFWEDMITDRTRWLNKSIQNKKYVKKKNKRRCNNIKNQYQPIIEFMLEVMNCCKSALNINEAYRVFTTESERCFHNNNPPQNEQFFLDLVNGYPTADFEVFKNILLIVYIDAFKNALKVGIIRENNCSQYLSNIPTAWLPCVSGVEAKSDDTVKACYEQEMRMFSEAYKNKPTEEVDSTELYQELFAICKQEREDSIMAGIMGRLSETVNLIPFSDEDKSEIQQRAQRISSLFSIPKNVETKVQSNLSYS